MIPSNKCQQPKDVKIEEVCVFELIVETPEHRSIDPLKDKSSDKKPISISTLGHESEIKMNCWIDMESKTKPAPELLLAQLILSVILVVVVSHATYEKEYEVPTFTFQMHKGKPIFRSEGRRAIPINEFRASYTVLLLLGVSSAYFFVNLLLYLTIKMLREDVMYGTILILVQDVAFFFLMLVSSIGAVAHRGERAVNSKETEILIASGISMFCCVSSGVGVYYSYRVYKGL